MGIQSIAQILTASFLPVLSGFQDDRERLLRAMRKMNRFTAYLVFPLLLLLTTCAELKIPCAALYISSAEGVCSAIVLASLFLIFSTETT
jgi:O-antigen/teichoic acid export membrane protein